MENPNDTICYSCENGEHDSAYSDSVHLVEKCSCTCNKEKAEK